ncbi:MAG TPA: citramalate synthase [Dictyoglomaceae bacterium]|nr:citramalate synthase [Dictyoglomaceae bacterium]HOL39791.1 citramalate synthase [Dictyoglomaceae bacterium]HOP95328.1 citramalate synthase [Dictyoglomaceae bacterium]HPP16206.1 citramalate synthase [Dictyoglomaceae bacterium]HPU42932.1 citramalate synthase [Dictyoglomaceae bacterium]
MEKIFLYDTTLRDGAQSERISFSLEDKLRIAQRLDDFGIDYIEGGWPGSNPKDLNFFKGIKEVPLNHSKIAAFGSTRRAQVAPEDDANLKALLESDTPVVTIFGKSWNFHVTEVLRTTLENNLKMIYDSIKYLKSHNKEIIYDAEHFFDGFKADPEYALSTLDAACEGGADCIVLADTNGGSLPWEITDIIKKVKERIKIPLGIHTHNDSGLAVANTIVAVQEGAIHIQGTMNGYGERCGNANLCTIIPILSLKMGLEIISDEKLAQLTDLSHWISEIANLPPDPSMPFVGRSAFAHKGGVHVNAILKNQKSYEHIDPTKVGNKRRILVSELSGTSTIVSKAKELNINLDRDSSLAKLILDKVNVLENEGYYFEGAEASFELLIRHLLGEETKLFDLIGLRVIVEKIGEEGETTTEATLKLKIKDNIVHVAAEGNGPVNALDEALRKALIEFYPDLKNIHLSDFKVRVLNGNSGTAAKVRVLIDSANADGDTWSTVGVSPNIIEASWEALVQSIEYGILKRREV